MKNSIWKTHENCEGSISLTRRIRKLRRPSRMLVRSWKHQLLLLCLVKLWKIVGVVHPTKLKTKLPCIQEADESTRMRMGNSIPHHHEDHIAGKGENSLRHYDLVHKFIPMPQAMKIPAAKAAVDKEWEKSEKSSAWNLTKVRSKKEVIDEAKMSGVSSFRLTDGHMSFEKCWIGGKAPKVQRSSCTPRWYCKRRFRVLRSMHWTRISSITNDSIKNHGYHLQIASLRWTSSRRSISLYPSENGRCSQIVKNSIIRVSRHLDSSFTTRLA